MAISQPEPRAERVLELYEDLQAISAAGGGVLVPHLDRLMTAVRTNPCALDKAIRRWRSEQHWASPTDQT